MARLWHNAIVYSDTAANLAADTRIYSNNSIVFSEDTGVLKRGNNFDVYSALLPIGGGGESSGPKLINDESLTLIGETSAGLNTKFPESNIGDTYFSVVNDVKYTKITSTQWDQQGLTIV